MRSYFTSSEFELKFEKKIAEMSKGKVSITVMRFLNYETFRESVITL